MVLLSNITAKEARENYNVYHKNLQNNKFTLLQSWLERIEKFSNEGYNSIFTTHFYINQSSQMVSYVNETGLLIQVKGIPLSEIVDFFEERGFKIELKKESYNIYYYIISW